MILEQGRELHEQLYLVLSGQVRLVETTVGNVTRSFGEGKLFGQYGLLRGGALPYQAEALSDVTLATVPAATFHQLCETHPRVLAFFESDIRAYTRHHLTLYDLSGAQFLFGTRLSDLVHREAPRCGPDISVREAATIMSEQNCDYLVVLRGTTTVGLLTDGDLRRKIVAAAGFTGNAGRRGDDHRHRLPDAAQQPLRSPADDAHEKPEPCAGACRRRRPAARCRQR